MKVVALGDAHLGRTAGPATTNGINANVTTGVRSLLTVNATQYSSFNGRFGASGTAIQYMDFAKTGPAAFTLANTVHTITGSVSVLGGTLEVTSTPAGTRIEATLPAG